MMILMALIFTACSNEDIEIEKTGEVFSVNYNVSTQALYDELDMTYGITNQILRNETYQVGVYTFVYDNTGKLVDSKFSARPDLNSVSENFSGLTEGNYTFVSIQTIVNPEQDYKSPKFSIIDTESLSTLKIKLDNPYVYWYQAVGVSITQETISGEKTLNVTPEAIGSIIQVNYLNFDKSNYPKVAFGTTDRMEYYRLDPSVPENDRINIDLSAKGIFQPRDTQDVNSDELGATLFIIENNIDYGFWVKKSEDLDNTTWYSWNSTKGSFTLEHGKTYEGGMIYIPGQAPKAFLGSPQDYEAWLKNIENTTSASLIPDVVKTWNASVSFVQSAMKGYKMVLGDTGSAVPTTDDAYTLQYEGQDGSKVSRINYFFKYQMSGLYESDILYDRSSVNVSDLTAILDKEYKLLSKVDAGYYYLSSDSKTAVMLLTSLDDYYYLVFADMEYISSLGSRPAGGSNDVKTALRAFPTARLRNLPALDVPFKMEESAVMPKNLKFAPKCISIK